MDHCHGGYVDRGGYLYSTVVIFSRYRHIFSLSKATGKQRPAHQ
jgi:hypothetical protein